MGGVDMVAAGTCFFITLSDEAGQTLDGRFAAFGGVIGGWETVEKMSMLRCAQWRMTWGCN